VLALPATEDSAALRGARSQKALRGQRISFVALPKLPLSTKPGCGGTGSGAVHDAGSFRHVCKPIAFSEDLSPAEIRTIYENFLSIVEKTEVLYAR